MRHFLAIIIALFAALTMVAADSVEAKRLGGGRSLGTQRQAAPPPPSASSVAPANPAAAAPALPAKAAAPASGASRWLGPLAGLAAGLGLAALLSHFGLSEGFASILMLALLVFAGLFLIRMFMARRTPQAPMQYAGAGTGSGTVPDMAQPGRLQAGPSANRFEPVWGGAAASPETPPAANYPPGFDPVPFLKQATMQFRKLQAAYDSGDRKMLADVMTPEMFAEIDKEIAERGAHVPTEVTDIDADVLEVTTEGDRHWASVHFKGSLREDGMLLPKPFDEIWNLAKPVDGKTGWLLAGIRQLA
ncbi:MAG TPA: Tim44-like domain-containing protein [Casimicrobiaceae bacterium]|nr:Tim44-like domain-containing protein [Casimicrobiaceae bacterium]